MSDLSARIGRPSARSCARRGVPAGAVGGDAAIYSTMRTVAGASPQTVSTTDAATQPDGQLTSGSYSWSVRYVSDNTAQRNIPASCHETSDLTISNGGTISSP